MITSHAKLRLMVMALCVTAAILSAQRASVGDDDSGQSESGNSARGRAARQEVLNKRRRIIFNDDSYETSRPDANTPEGFLRRRLQPLVGTPVDTISFSVLGGWGDAPVYDSKVQPVYGDAHGGPPNEWSQYTARNIKALIDSGRDALQIVIDFAHANEMELFASIRMNDSHDSFLPPLVTLWKKDHPELLVDRGDVPADKDAHPKGLYVIAQDFAHQDVRDRKFEIIEEVCQRYDIDGIDLNFIRHPVFFSRTMRGEPVRDDEIEVMTNFLRRIRKMTDQHGTRRDKPILVATIVPDNLGLAKNIGLDIEAWIKDDLIDIVIPGLGYAPFTLPVREFTDLAHPHGVKVYPCINRVAPHQVPFELVPEGFRGVASNWYRAGADGIFFWNLGTPIEHMTGDEMVRTRNQYYAALPDLGSTKSLIAKDKLFCLDDPVISYYQHISSRPLLPVKLCKGTATQVPLVVGDDVNAARQDLRPQLRLTLGTGAKLSHDAILARINGRQLKVDPFVSSGEKRKSWTYVVEPAAVALGENTLQVSLQDTPSAAAESVQLVQVRLLLRYRQE